MNNPYAWLPFRHQLVLFVFVLVATLCWGRYLSEQGASLKTKLTHGVVEFETPWSQNKADGILQSLDAGEKATLRRNIQLDFVFLLLYPLAISLLCSLVAPPAADKQAIYGVIAIWAVLAAAPLDAAENIAMLFMLDGHTRAPVPAIATICATLKFGLVFGGFAYAIVGLVRKLAACFGL